MRRQERCKTQQAARIIPYGDSALLVVFGEAIDPELNARVHALAAAIRARRAAGAGAWGVPVPAYSSLLAPYDPLQWDYPASEAALAALLSAEDRSVTALEDAGSVVEIPVRYGGADGPDLVDVAARHGLTPAEVIAIHSGARYRVYMLGFAPGFVYLGPLPAALETPRRATPRTQVPAGSVAIAGAQTGVYPLATPGGWHLLGRTDALLWDLARDPPALLRPGQALRFVPI